MAALAPAPKFYQTDENGAPLAGGFVYTYISGTTTPLATYTDAGGGTANTNPVELDSAGRCNMWLLTNSLYKFVVTTSTGVPVYTVNNIGASATTVILSISGGANMVGFNQTATYNQGTVGLALQTVVNPKNAPFNALGGGANDTVAIQAAIEYCESISGTLWLDEIFYVARNVGTNDRWGVKVVTGNITITGPGGLARYDTDISTYALAYPPLFIGTPDSNVAAATENVTIDGLTFVGNNTRHAVSGNVIHDFRNAIEAKNTKNLKVLNNKFTNIDSAVIFYQQPGTIDNANGVYYNKTKNYNSQFKGNYCVANSHSTAGRALIHAVAWPGVDNCEVSDNDFIWCDDCVAGEGTYNDLSDVETNTYTYSSPPSAAALGALKRCGRGWQFIGNRCFNSSEHPYYGAGMDTVCSNNIINNSNDTICVSAAIKERSRGSVITGNRISNYPSAVLIDSPAFDVTVTGNGGYCTQQGAAPSAAVTVQTDDLKAYIDARPWLSGYTPMGNFTISGNDFSFQTGAATNERDIGVTVYTNVGADAATWPEGMIQGVNIVGNTFRNYKYGVYVVGTYHRTVNIDNNTFTAKPFVSSGFAGGTTLNTVAPLLINDSSTSAGLYIKFSNNYVSGATYVASTLAGGGASVLLPYGMVGNKLFYVKNFKTADFVAVGPDTRFSENTGYFFLDRTGWCSGWGLNNSLNDGTTSTTAYKFIFQYDSGGGAGSKVLFYYNDAGGNYPLG